MPDQVAAIIPAAGQGLRMGGSKAKQFRRLGGMPILTRTCLALRRAKVADWLVVVVPPGSQDAVREQCLKPFGLEDVEVVAGGAQRQDSVRNGVERAMALGASWLVVHDGVRPLAPPELFHQVLAMAKEHGAAIAAGPCVDTVKEAGEGDLVAATKDRGRLWLVQTPQAFEAGLLIKALELADRQGFKATDEAGLVERMGKPVKLVPGPRHNIKITTPEDLCLAQGWLGGGGGGGGGDLRVGQGLDAHRLVEGRPLILGGVRIEHHLGLLGHSDADVLTHAVMDALLAAAGLGDIGRHFPDTDPAYKGADSLELLAKVRELLTGAGFAPRQVSATVAAQRPKLATHFPAMRANLARALNIEPEMINLAATTTEGLGFVGREEGITALASATLVCFKSEGADI